MNQVKLFSAKNLSRDLPAGIVVFLVALPLCLGIALASNAPLFSGVVSGIIGGIVIGMLSGSQTSVAGPAAGLAAIVASQIDALGSFQALLLATMMAGAMQLVLGIVRAGFIASFFPSSVVKGLLAAIGILLILKQIPHAIGHDPDPVGEMAFNQPDNENTFSELAGALFDIHPSAAIIGLLSLAVLVFWDRVPALKRTKVPVPLVVAVLGVGLNLAFATAGGRWLLESNHLVQVPVLESLGNAGSLLEFPDWSQWNNPRIYLGAVTIAIVASLETLLNLEAVDRLDPKQRTSPPSRELMAQGAGNMVAGLFGGLPLTSVIVRSSVNVHAGNETKLSAIFHGFLLLLCVLLVPQVLNLIPLATLAAILIVTGFKLASPKVISRMWREGWTQFLPFAVTIAAIVLTDLLIGILTGLTVSIAFILHSNLRRPVKRVLEKHAGGDILRLELGENVSFLNRAALEETLQSLPSGQHVLLDAENTNYIDPDILNLIHDFQEKIAPAHGLTVSLVGFKDRYSRLQDNIQFVDYSTRELQTTLTPGAVLDLLREGNRRFRTGQRLPRDLRRQVSSTADGQAPLAAILSCIDSRTPSELVFDVGIGDIFSVRIAGNVAKEKVLGSLEYSCAVAGAKLILVLGHTSCGAISSAVDFFGREKSVGEVTGCEHIDVLVNEIHKSMDPNEAMPNRDDAEAMTAFKDQVALRNVERVMRSLRKQSRSLDRMVRDGKVAIVAGIYDVRTGVVEFIESDGPLSRPLADEDDELAAPANSEPSDSHLVAAK